MTALWAILCVMPLTQMAPRLAKGNLFGDPHRNFSKKSTEHHGPLPMPRGNAKTAQKRNAATRARQSAARSKPRRAAQVAQSAPRLQRSAREAPARQQENKLAGKVNGEDAALVNFLDALTNPEALPVRVPLLLGEFVLETDLYQVEYSGQSAAGTGGIAFVGVAPDNWFTNANDGTPSDQFVADNIGTQGRPVWYSVSTGAGVVDSGAVGSANGAALAYYGTAGKSLGPGISLITRLRCTAVNLEVWSDAAAQTATGDICIASVQGTEGISNSALNGQTYQTASALKQDYVSHQEFPLAGWKSGQRVHTHLTQWDEQCFALEHCPVNGLQTLPHYGLLAVASGMATGQTFSWKVTFNYETTKYATFQTDSSSGRVPYLEPSRVVNAMTPLRARPPTLGPAGHGAGKGLNAMVMANPDKAQALMRPGAGNPTFTDNLASTAKKGLGWLASKIPYVGGLASSAVDWLFS